MLDSTFCEDGTTGAAIKDLIIGAVADLGLSMDDCLGNVMMVRVICLGA